MAELVSLAPRTLEALGVARSSAPLVDAARKALDLLPDDKVDSMIGYAREAFTSVQQHTPPGTWPEGLLKNLLIIGMGLDLTRLTRESWPPVVAEHLTDDPGPALADLLTETLSGLDMDEEVTSRTSLFGRRVLAELSAQAQRIASRSSAVALALTGAERDSLDEVTGAVELLQELVEGGAQRMLALGLQP